MGLITTVNAPGASSLTGMSEGQDEDDRLLALYNDPSVPGSFRGYKGIQQIAKERNLGNVTTARARRILEGDRSYTLHGRVVKGAKNLNERIVTSWPFDMWEADLMDAPHTREQLRRNKYLLCVIDVHTKYAMVRVLDNKEGKTVAEALRSIIDENVPPYTRLNALRTDAGTEFFNRHCKALVYKPLGINHYRGQKEPGACVVERFIGTLARVMARYVSRHPSITQAALLARVPDFVDSYNRTKHSAVRQTAQPLHDEAYERGSKSGIQILREVASGAGDLTPEEDEAHKRRTIAGLYLSTSLGRNKDPNPWDPEQGERVDMPLEPGRRVRVLTRQDIFSKGTRRKAFSDEVFTVSRVSRNNPNAYYLKDERGEDIDGKFYRRQLQALTGQPDRWEVRVLRRRRHRGRRQLLVEWVGHPHLPAEWIPEEDAE